MKVGISLVLGILGIVFALMGVPGCLAEMYTYKVTTGQYVSLADDASTAPQKLEYILKFKKSCENIGRNDARFFFKQEQYTRDAQLKILNTLITRLQDASNMNPSSIEYQQAMYQISGQEFDTALQRIDSIMKSCYMRSSIFIWLWGMWLIIGGIFLILCMAAILDPTL